MSTSGRASGSGVPRLVSVVDAWIQPWTAEDVVGRMPERRRNPYLQGRYGQDDRKLAGISVEQMIDEMDAAGIDFALLSAGPMVPMRAVLKALDHAPDRFAALAWADPTEGVMNAVRDLRALVRNHNIVGYRLEPFLVRRNPNDAVFYPMYAACVELDITFAMQVGGTAPLYTSRTGQPMFIDDIALDFPELRIVCGHVGTPWANEMIHVASKHANVYIDTSARLARYFEPEFVRYLSSYGNDKCMFASDWPILPFDRALNDAREGLALAPERARHFYAQNAIDAYRLPLSVAGEDR